LEKEGIEVWFEEINFNEGEIVSFVYGVEVGGEKDYIQCEVNEEYNEEVEKLKEELGMETGVFIVFEK